MVASYVMLPIMVVRPSCGEEDLDKLKKQSGKNENDGTYKEKECELCEEEPDECLGKSQNWMRCRQKGRIRVC